MKNNNIKKNVRNGKSKMVISKRLLRSITPEVKITDALVSGTSGTVALSFPLHEIAQGTAYNERVGFSVDVLNIHMKFILRAGVSLGSTPIANVRMIIIQDLQQQDSTSPTFLDVFSVLDTVSALNWFNKSRFRTIHDRMLIVDLYHPTVIVDLHKTINSTLKFSGALNTNITKNGIYMFLLSDNAVNSPTYEFWNRTKYTDA